MDQGVSASTLADVKTVLSAIFTTALNDQIAAVHPRRGVKTPTVARKPRTIVTPEQFDLIHSALPDQRWQVLVELDVESGLRWGELTELRVRDFTAATRMLTVARAVVEINARFRDPDAPRFVVKDYPKDKEYRRVKLSPEIAAALAHHIEAHGLGRDDLLFAMPTPEPPLDAATVDETPGRHLHPLLRRRQRRGGTQGVPALPRIPPAQDPSGRSFLVN
jgi:integrase